MLVCLLSNLYLFLLWIDLIVHNGDVAWEIPICSRFLKSLFEYPRNSLPANEIEFPRLFGANSSSSAYFRLPKPAKTDFKYLFDVCSTHQKADTKWYNTPVLFSQNSLFRRSSPLLFQSFQRTKTTSYRFSGFVHLIGRLWMRRRRKSWHWRTPSNS